LVAAHAFVLEPKNKPKVLTTIMRRLGTNDKAIAEDGLDDLIRRTDRKLHASAEGLKNIQRFVQLRNPKLASINVADLIDRRYPAAQPEPGRE